MLNKIQLSIIILTKNNPEDLLITLKSLFPFYQRKTLLNLFEVLIIDKSKNNSVEDIYHKFKNLEFQNIRYLKQNDEGIFAAFNIGAKKSLGRYIWFLNSGDTFSQEMDIQDFFRSIMSFNYSVIIYKTKILSLLLKKKLGEQPIFFPKNTYIYKLLNLFLPYAFGYCHQSIIFKRDFHLENLYKYPNMIGQDSKLTQKVLKSRNFKLININLSNFYMGGISNSIPETNKIFLKILRDRLKNQQFISLISLIIKHYFFQNNIQVERAIYIRNKVLQKIFLFLNFLK